jgi:3D (Asp-Asp-Asp) domain-containing protein
MPPAVALGPILALALITDASHTQPKPNPDKARRFTASAYCEQGTTKSGTPARQGIAAADPRVLPLGTVVQVEHADGRTATYLIADTGSAVKGRHLDIFMSSCAAAKRFGRRTVLARVTRSAPAQDQGR